MKQAKKTSAVSNPKKALFADKECDVCDNDECSSLYTMTFPEDYRKSNPSLHMLYTKWAIPHLVEIDVAIKKFYGFSNLNMLGVLEALSTERNKLCKEKAAYAEADEIIKSIHKHSGLSENKE